MGKGTTVKRAILDKNTRIGSGVSIINKDNVEEADRSDQGFYIHNGIDGGPRLHHHQNPAGAFQLANEIFEVSGALNVFVLATPLEEVFGFGVGAVVDNAGKTVAFRIQDEVLAHHAKTDEAEVRLGHGLQDH